MQDWMSKLERAKALLDAGALTPEEFEAEKARLLPSSSSTVVDHNEHLIVGPEEDEPSARPRWIKAAIAAALAITIATIAYLLLADRSPKPAVKKAAPLPQTATPTPVASPTPRPTPTEAEFGCIGAYSNVSFSEESGDGSGLFVRIRKSGSITWKYYEGGISRGNVKVNKRSADRISATVRYVDDPNEPPSAVVLKCNAGTLSASSANIGNFSLRRLTAKQAAELDL